MIYNNNTITAITYSGYDIVRAYSCEDKLVFGNEPSPHEHVKIHMYFVLLPIRKYLYAYVTIA